MMINQSIKQQQNNGSIVLIYWIFWLLINRNFPEIESRNYPHIASFSYFWVMPSHSAFRPGYANCIMRREKPREKRQKTEKKRLKGGMVWANSKQYAEIEKTSPWYSKFELAAGATRLLKLKFNDWDNTIKYRESRQAFVEPFSCNLL